MGIQNKTYRCIKICIIIAFLLFEVYPEEVGGELSAKEILKNATSNMYPPNVTYTAKMTIKRPNKEYIKRLRVYIKGKDSALVEFLYPPKEEGVRVLAKGDYCWMYLPSVERVIRLSGKTSLVGGEFTHHDVLRVRLEEDYDAISLKEENGHYILELKAKNKKISYDKIRYYVDKKNYLPLRAEFYVLGDRLLKILSYENPKLFGGRIIPSILIMENAFTRDYTTILELEDVDFSPLPERIFTQDYLKRGR